MNQCKVKITDGKIAIGRENVRDLIRCKKDGYYSIQVKKWTRTLSQNALMWSWITILADYHGMDKNAMYNELIDAYSWIYTYEDLNGKPKQAKVTTSQMSTDEMSHFMECIVRHASEFEVSLPMPKDE